MTPAFEAIAGSADAPVFLTCEHASEALPEGHRWAEPDRRLSGTHWAFDLGAREITLELAAALNAPAVLATFSRLWIDPNRPLDSETLFRGVADGEPILLNASLDAASRQQRIDAHYRPFHAAIDERLGPTRCPIVLAIHTFTPLYEGQPRKVELGVLFDHEDALGQKWTEHLRALGHDARANEPWSGKAGLIHVAQTHADAHGRRAMELEVRQDLAVDPAFRKRLIPELVAMLRG